MAARPKTVGGGNATGLGNDFWDFLRQGLNTGTFGNSQMNSANPLGSTQGIAGVLNDILAGGAGKVGGGLQAMIARQNANNVANLRARYGAGGGTSLGTPGAYAEGTYLAQHAEDAPVAIGNLQLSALQPLLQLMGRGAEIGTPQAQTIMQQSDFGAALQGLAGIGSAISPLLMPNPFKSPTTTLGKQDPWAQLLGGAP